MYRTIRCILVALIVFIPLGLVQVRVGNATAESIPSTVGGFIPLGGSLSMGRYDDSKAPALAHGRRGAAASLEPWLAFEGTRAGSSAVAVATFDGVDDRWERRDGELNTRPTGQAISPDIAFTGPNRTQPWTAFTELANQFDGARQILVSKYSVGGWGLVGELQFGLPTLNVNSQQDANFPAIASGDAGAASLPWVTWSEQYTDGTSQIYVRRAAADPSAQGGYRWVLVGKPGRIADPTLNMDVGRDGLEPDIAFAGQNGAVPWVVWSESGEARPERVFAARGVADASALGGYRWEWVGSQANCGSNETACALNVNPAQDAQAPSIADGMLPNETIASPWVAYSERAANGISQIYVKRLDGGRFRRVGGSLNVSPTQDAHDPDITFVGNVPHVAWSEEYNGVTRIFVRNLADARPAFERWDLTTAPEGVSRDALASTLQPTISSDGETPVIAWTEGEDETNVFAAIRSPIGPAWGYGRPPFIRVISGDRTLTLDKNPIGKRLATGAEANASQASEYYGFLAVTTSCAHAQGWKRIREIQFMLSDAARTIFVGRYVAAENKVYVQDPDDPNRYLGGVPPGTPLGSGGAIDTRYVTLRADLMRVINHVGGSAALDIDWPIGVKRTIPEGEYVQSINIVYESEGTNPATVAPQPEQVIIESTGFFRVGKALISPVNARYKVWLPQIRR